MKSIQNLHWQDWTTQLPTQCSAGTKITFVTNSWHPYHNSQCQPLNHNKPPTIEEKVTPHRPSQSSKETEDQESFFRERPLPQSSSHFTVHNLSSITFNTSDINLISKGLMFSPTPQYTNTDLLQFLPNHYDNYANAIRRMINSPKRLYSTNQQDPETICPQTTMSFIHRKMKFLTNQDTEQYQIPFTNIVPVEGYIENTKVIKLKDNFAAIFKPTKTLSLNLQERRSIKDIKWRRDDIIIKQKLRHSHSRPTQLYRTMPSTSVLHFIQISPTVSLIYPSKPSNSSHQFSYRDPHLLPTTLSFLSHTSSETPPTTLLWPTKNTQTLWYNQSPTPSSNCVT